MKRFARPGRRTSREKRRCRPGGSASLRGRGRAQDRAAARRSIPEAVHERIWIPRQRPGSALEREPPGEHLEQRSEEHTSELQSLMRISYDVFCLKTKSHLGPDPPDT